MKRPDAVDLIGPEYDRDDLGLNAKTLVICSAPRSGSYELCRLLTAAGVGVPHEYFHQNYAAVLGGRFGLKDPLHQLPAYIELLRRRRAQNGVFATKLQFWQFQTHLKNEVGAALFEGATVVHLFRPDVAKQFASFRASLTSGRWDFSDRITSFPEDDSLEKALASLEILVAEDAGFRRLFALTGVDPLFVTTGELSSRPEQVVRRIADLLGVTINESGLGDAVEIAGAYARPEARGNAISQFASRFKAEAFRQD